MTRHFFRSARRCWMTERRLLYFFRSTRQQHSFLFSPLFLHLLQRQAWMGHTRFTPQQDAEDSDGLAPDDPDDRRDLRPQLSGIGCPRAASHSSKGLLQLAPMRLMCACSRSSAYRAPREEQLSSLRASTRSITM
jgi:hypothetical protein